MNLLPDNVKQSLAAFFKHRWTLWALRFAVLILVFLAFYLPFQSQAKKISQKYDLKSKQIDAAKQGGLQVLKPDEIATLQKRVDDFEKGLGEVSRAAGLLAYVSDTATQNHIKVTKINSDPPAVVTDPEKKELMLGGKKLMKIPVNLRFEADFKTFTSFLHQVSNSPKYSVAIESFFLKQTNPPSERIQCEVTLSFFGMSAS